jgi:hypothetical protein
MMSKRSPYRLAPSWASAASPGEMERTMRQTVSSQRRPGGNGDIMALFARNPATRRQWPSRSLSRACPAGQISENTGRLLLEADQGCLPDPPMLRQQRGHICPAALMGVQRRQVFRLLCGLRRDGLSSLISKRRGKPSSHRLPAEVRERYADFVQPSRPRSWRSIM